MPNAPHENPKAYIGDGVCVEWDGESLILTTRESDIIYLDVDTYTHLTLFVERYTSSRKFSSVRDK